MRIEEIIINNSIKWESEVATFDHVDSITYKELTKNIYQVAQRLKKYGIERGDRVCIISERNTDGLIIILAILSIGAIYVPVSLDYPEKRIEYIVKDCLPKIVIIEDSIKNAAYNGNIILKSTLLGKSHLEKGVPNILNEASADDIAYILYTSGSTGLPKGVMISHKAAINTLTWMIDEFKIKEGECIPQKTAWGFTDSIWELFLPLMVGGKISFISDDEIKNSILLYERLKNDKVVITQFVPPALSVFLDDITREVEKPDLINLRWVLNGGEELTRKIVDKWFDVFPNVGYANPYGMTESAIYATNYLMMERPVWGMRKIPIGTPIKNTRVYILSESNEILEKENQGEICIGGESLFSGYWNKADETNRNLIKHPQINELIYKTGDIGVKRTDDLILYKGRKDNQVNINGMRVELDEIKHALLENQDIAQVALIVKEYQDYKKIIAFYSTKNEEQIKLSILFAQVRKILPEYMVPSFFFHLNRFPLTEHNKINYRELHKIDINTGNDIVEEVSGVTKIENELIQIWSGVLDNKRFSLDDAFFNIGGNSLMLMKVYARLPEKYRQFLKVSDLINFPSVKSLSTYIEKQLTNNETKSVEFTTKKDRSALAERRNKRNKINK